MFFYPFYQWLLFFFLYCFLGWIWETSYVSVLQKHFVNRGFMYGTAIPIYGFGAIAMLIATLPFKNNLIAVYFVGLIAATVLELFTGLAMERIFKVKYWDYSNQKLNYKGYICVSSSLFWGLLSVVLVKWVHSFFERQLNKIPVDTQYAILITVIVVFLTDLGLSVKAALDLRKVIIQMEKLKKEMDRIKDELADRVDRTVEEISGRVDQTVDELSEKFSQTREAVSDKFDATRDAVSEKIDSTVDAVTDRIESTVDVVSDKLEATKDAVSDRFDATKDAMSDKLDSAKEALEQQQEALKNLTAKLVRRHPTAKLPTIDKMRKEIKKRTEQN